MISLKQRLHLENLHTSLESIIKRQVSNYSVSHSETDSFLVTRQRHRDLLCETLECLSNFRRDDLLPDMAVEELRAAIHAIGRITGRIDVEDVLDVLFKEFCIGK